MAHSATDRRGDRRAQIEDGNAESPISEREYEQLRQFTSVVRVAMGRLGATITPWLDEGLLMGQGLVTLLELAGDPAGEGALDDAAVGWVVSGMRTWARASSWYRSAWPCRIAPLCSSLAKRDADAADDRATARDLGLGRDGLVERYVEAGLLFGVSPELLLPEHPRAVGLTDAVSELAVEQRQLLTLYFEDGLNLPEIAEALEISPERAQETYGRAATKIRARVFGPSRSAEVLI